MLSGNDNMQMHIVEDLPNKRKLYETLFRGIKHNLIEQEVCRLEQNNNTNQLASLIDNILQAEKIFKNGKIDYVNNNYKHRRSVKDYRKDYRSSHYSQNKKARYNKRNSDKRKSYNKHRDARKNKSRYDPSKHCKACDKKGHTVRYCKDKKARREFLRKHNLCLYCAGVGHSINACPEKNNGNDRGGGNRYRNKKYYQDRKRQSKDRNSKYGGKHSKSRYKGKRIRQYYQAKGEPSEISDLTESETPLYSEYASTDSNTESEDTSSKEEEKYSQEEYSQSESQQLNDYQSADDYKSDDSYGSRRMYYINGKRFKSRAEFMAVKKGKYNVEFNGVNKEKCYLLSRLQKFDMETYNMKKISEDQLPGDKTVEFRFSTTSDRTSNDYNTGIKMKALADGGSTLNSITRKCANDLIKQHPGLKMRKRNKFPVENGGGHDVVFSGDYITVWMIKPKTRQFYETDIYITPYDEIAYPLIIGDPTLRRLNYHLAYFDKENSRILFKHNKETIAFDVHKNDRAWEMMDYLGGHSVEQLEKHVKDNEEVKINRVEIECNNAQIQMIS